jgi:hypothetical protein
MAGLNIKGILNTKEKNMTRNEALATIQAAPKNTENKKLYKEVEKMTDEEIDKEYGGRISKHACSGANSDFGKDPETITILEAMIDENNSKNISRRPDRTLDKDYIEKVVN